jgi:para-nitrobenzyl esterase
MARAMTRVGQPGFLYNFSFVAPFGAYHGEELYFLSDSFPAYWEYSKDDESLGQAMRGYWVQFAKTGNPNSSGLPNWPTYGA